MSENKGVVQNSELGNLQIGMNTETAGWVNSQLVRMERGTRLLLDTALNVGKVLFLARGKSDQAVFTEWFNKNIILPKSTAYDYMKLGQYEKEITQAQNLNEAYKMIETLQAQEKQSETTKANQRVAEYRKTGVKPDGWRRGTDDKLAKEEAERDARIEAVKQDALKRGEEKQESERKREEQKRDMNREIERDNALINQTVKELQKRADFKEKIRLSADGKKDPFQDAIIDYLNELESDSRRIEACFNIIKICKRIANELQAK